MRLTVNGFIVNEMLSMQKELQNKYKDIYQQILTKQKNTIRKELIEETANVLMYYNDVMQYNHIEWTEFTV